MGSFINSLSDQPLTSRDKRMLLSLEFSREMAERSNERLFDLGLKEVDAEIKESKEKGLKRAKIYKIARIIVNLIGVALICIVPIAIIFNLPIWVPIVVTLVGGIALGLLGNALKSREQLLRLRHKSLLQYRQRLAKKLYTQNTWKNKAAKNEVNNERSLSERMKLVYHEFGIDTDASSGDTSVSEGISPLNLDSPLFLHRYEAGAISKDTQTILNSWKLYQREVLNIKTERLGKANSDTDLLALRDRIYSEGGVAKELLPLPDIADGLQEIKSFCSYGLQVSDLLQNSLKKYRLAFPLLSLVADTKLGLDFNIESKQEELSLLDGQLQHYLRKLAAVKTEEEALSVIEEISSLGILSRVRTMINSSSSLNSSILSKISFHPTNRILSCKQRLAHLKLELQDPVWAADWFESSDHQSWKDKVLAFCSCCKKDRVSREEVRERLLTRLNETESLLLELERVWTDFLNNDFAKLHLEDSQEKIKDLFKDLGEGSFLDKKNLKPVCDKIKDLKTILSEEMIGADNESAAEKILEVTKSLNDFEEKDLSDLERIVANRGRSALKFIAKSLTTKNSTFRRRKQEAEQEYREKISASGNLTNLSQDIKTSAHSYVNGFKELLTQLEHIEKTLSEESDASKETELLEACHQVQDTCQKFSIDDVNHLKSHLSTLSKKLHCISEYKKSHSLNPRSNILNDLTEGELETEVNALEQQFESERKEVDKIRERCRTTLDHILENIEKQSVGIYLGQTVSNIVLSIIFFVIMAILGIFLVSFNVWWVHLIFLGVSVGFIGLNFLLTYLIGLRAKEKLEIDLQKDFLISSEMKTSTYFNPDLDRLKKLQGELGLDGIHSTWAKKEFLDEHAESSKEPIINKSKEEVTADLKAWHKELNRKNIPTDSLQGKAVKRKIPSSENEKQLNDLYVEQRLLEKSITSKETLLYELINEQLTQEHELFLLEKEDLQFKNLSFQIEKEKQDIQKKQELLTSLKTKQQFLASIINSKKEELTKENLEKAQGFFKDLLFVYQDESLSHHEKKEKAKPILKAIYAEGSIALVHELIENAYSQNNNDKCSFDESTITSFQKRGLLADSPLKETLPINIQYLKHLINNLEIIEADINRVPNSPEFIEAVQQANFLMEEFPILLKEVELFSIFTPCPKTEKAREISLEIEKAKKEMALRKSDLMASSLTNLHSMFSSLLQKLIKKDFDKIEKASAKLDKFLFSVVGKASKFTEKEEKRLIEAFQKLPLYVLKDLEKQNLIKMSGTNVSLHIFKSKLEKVAYIEECLNRDKKEFLSLETHRKVLKQKKEKDILEKRKVVKAKLREIEELKQKKLVKEKAILKLRTEEIKAKLLEMEELKKKQLVSDQEILSLEQKLERLTTEKKIAVETPSSTIKFQEIFSPGITPNTYEGLLTKMILSRKEVQRFSSLYEKERKKDPIHANHMKRMHKQSKGDYEKCYKDLIFGISDSSLNIPQDLNVPVIKQICEDLLKTHQLLEQIEKDLDDLSEKEIKVLALQEKIGKMKQKRTSLQEKISELEASLVDLSDSSQGIYRQRLQSYEEKLISLNTDINECVRREDDLLQELQSIASVRGAKQTCLQEIKALKQKFFNEQQRS